MSDKKTKLKATIIKLRSIFSRISVHYFAYTIAFLFVTFSVMHFVTAATPNPGHPWNEIGDGVFAVTYNQTAPRTYTFPDANATVLTTNDTVTVAQGGTGLSSIASGSVLVANTINTLSALTSTTGTKVLTNTNGSITWGTAPDSMVYPSAGIAVSTGSAWGTSITDNSSNWNTAYGWGNHASAGYLLSTGATTGATSQAQLFTNGIISPTILGGTSTTQDLTFKTTSGVGTTGADMHFLVGNNGATEAMTILNNGNVGIGTTAPVAKLDISDIGSQLRLSYDLTNYSELTTNTNGNLNIKTKGVSNFFIGNETVISGYSNIWPGGVTPSSSNYTWQNKNDGTEIWFNAAGASGQIYFDINNSATVPLFIKGSNVSIGFLYSAVPTSLFNVNGSAYFAGNIGIGQTSPTARLHLPAGTATAGTAPLKLTAGTNLTTPEAGAIEFNGTDLFFTPSTTRETIAFVSDLPSLLGYVPYTGATTNLDLGSYDLFMTGSIGKTESRLTKGWFTDLEVTNAIVGSITGNAGTVTNGLYTTTGLMLDQTTPQTLINGIPLLAETRVINEAHQLVDKAYVDEAFASLGAKFYMLSTPSGIGTYYNTQTTPSIEAEGSITATDPADGGFIAGWISPSTGSPTKLIKGVYDWDIFVEKTGGNKVYRIYWTLVERKADTSEVVIATSANSNLIGSKSKQIVPLTLPNDYSLANGSRVVGKVYAKLESGASATNLVLYLEGLSDSHWETPTNKEILDNSYVTYTGAINNVNLGSNNLTTPLIIGGTATTSPLTLRSTSGVGTTGADIIFQTGNNGATEAMRILNNGFVGINDDAPTHRFSLMDDSVNYASLIWQQNAAGSGQYIGVNNTDSTKDALEVENSSGPIFTIKNNGNVGIGEYSPTSALTLGGSGTKAINRSVNTGNINIYGGTDYTNGAFFKLTGNSLNADPGNSSGEFTIGETTGTYASKFGIYSYNGSYWTSRFVVVGATGRVSIGAGNTPTAMLHIKAGTATAGTAPLKLTAGVNLTTPEAGAVEWDGTNLFVTQTTGPTRKTVAYTDSFTSTYVPYTGATTNVNLGSYSLTTPLVLGGTSTTQDLTFQTTSGVGATGADMHFLLGNNGATEAMTILNNGNVGIGTTSPSEKLEVGGDITANRIFATGSSSSNPGITIRGSRANLLFDTTGVTGGVAFDLIEAKVTNTDPVTAQWGNVGLFGSANLGGSPEASYMYFDALPDGAYNNTTLKVDANNRIGIGLPSTTRPTARLHLPAGTATAGTAPLKLTAGVNLTTPEAGVIEFDGTDLFFTPSTTRETVAFMSDITAASHDAVTLGTANGLSLSTQQLSLATASGSTTGALTSTDWNTFNNKQAALVSGTNIKTINSTSLLGSGDIAIAPMVYPGAGIPNSTGSAWGTSYTTSGSGTTLALTTTPTFTTNITTPLILGGTSTTQDLTFQTTSGIGTTGADMHFLVGNNGATEAMTILNNGNVGIGTIAPQASLHVNYPTSGNVVFQAGTGDGGSDMDIKYGYNGYGWYNRYLGSGSADNNEWQLWSEGAGGTDKQVYGIKQSGNIDFKEKVSIGTAGNTGPTLDIKTGTAPFTALKLTNYNTDAESLFAGVVSDSNIFLGTGYYYNSSLYRTPGTAASIARFEGGAFKIFTDSGLTANVDYTPTERFRITASGNVGVGEDNPLYKLHTSADSTTYAYGIYQNNVAGNGQYIWVNNADSSKDALQIDNSSNAIFTIKNDGKVGIGEYSPTSALTIGGSGTKAINRSVNTGNLDIYGGTDYTNGAYFKLTGSALNTNPGNSSGEFTIGEEAGTYASNFSIYSYNGGIWTPRFRLFGSTGNVGIGVLNPAEKLDVFGNTGGTYLKIHDQRSTTGDVAGIKLGTMPSGYDASMKTMIAHVETGSYGTGDLVFALNSLADISEVTLSDEKMRIKSNGNVQFGNNTSASTASPLNVSFGGTYGSNTPGDVGNLKWDMFTNGSTGNRYGIGMSLNLMEYQAGTSGQHAFFVNQGTEAMRISSGGNVGINNTNPDSLFSINSPTDDVSIMTLRFPAGSNNERVGILFKGNDGTYNINYAEMIGGVENWSADDGFIGFRTANNTSLAERARLTSNGTFEIGYNYTGQSGTLSDGLIVEGRTLLGATSEAVSSSKLYIEGTTSANGSSSAIAGILGGYTFNPTAGGVQVGNRFVVTNSPTTTANTAVGEIIRMVDSSTLANLVRGLDITSNAGSNTAGTNTGLRASGATFGIQGVTNALAGGVSIPAAIYGESTGTTQGDVLRLYSNTMTSASSFATFYHDTSTFTGTGLLMDFATGSGTFSGNFADFQKNNTSLFKVTNTGIVSMGLGSTSSTTAVCSSLATATSPTSGVAYEIRDCSSAPVADYAEMYPVEIDVTYGDIVTTGEEMINTYDTTNGEIDWNKVKGKISKLKKSNKPYDKKIIGIVSENYGDFSSVGYNIKESDNPKPVALNGRVPVKISEASLPIEIGDYITSSSENGKGMKAVKAGFVIGKALSSWSPNEGKDTVMIFIEQGYYNGEESANLISIDIESLGDTEVNFAEEILKKLLEKDISVENNYISEIFTDRLIAGLEIITPSITTNNLLASGEVTFNGLTYFNKEVEFAKSIKFNEAPEFVIPPLFNSDTAGFAVIKEGAQSVRIDFENPYVTTPVVNTTITFEKENEIDLESFFSSDLKSVVINKDQTGFTIVLNKRAPLDISFSWMALAVKDAKVFESLIDGLEIEYFDEEESEISEVNTQNQTTGNDFKVDIEDESQIDVVSEDVLNQNETIFETQDELGNSSSDEEANVDEVVASEDSILETSIGDDVLEEDLAEEMVSEMNNEIIQEESNPVEDFVNTE